MTIYWKTIEQFFAVVLFICQFSTVCNFFGKCIGFGLGTVMRERIHFVLQYLVGRPSSKQKTEGGGGGGGGVWGGGLAGC